MRLALLLSGDAVDGLALARSWSAHGDSVTAVLLDGAAALARAGHADQAHVQQALAAGVGVAVHDDALRRRGAAGLTAEGVKSMSLDEVADLVVEGADRVVWA